MRERGVKVEHALFALLSHLLCSQAIIFSFFLNQVSFNFGVVGVIVSKGSVNLRQVEKFVFGDDIGDAKSLFVKRGNLLNGNSRSCNAGAIASALAKRRRQPLALAAKH